MAPLAQETRRIDTSRIPPKKLPRLPQNARVSKRPLLRPPIASPHTSQEQPKVIYVSAKSPFMSVVKRVEKLLKLSEKRAVQSATTRVRKSSDKTLRRREQTATGDGDEITRVVRLLDDESGSGNEQVFVKGTGKAIPKVMEVGVWFQQREQYKVRIRTGTVRAIDDIEFNAEPVAEEAEGAGNETAETGLMDGDDDDMSYVADDVSADRQAQAAGPLPEDETRIRQISVLEVGIAMK